MRYYVIKLAIEGNLEGNLFRHDLVRRRPEEGLMLYTSQPSIPNGMPYDINRSLYMANSEDDQRALAKHLAEVFPGTRYACVSVTSVFSAVVSEVTEAKFDAKKGLLPA